MTRVIIAALAGIVCGLGLLLSGMTMPGKVTGFLDVGGAWDPSLAFVMGTAVVVFAPVVWLARGRKAPLFSDQFHWPTLQTIDRRLVAGSALFGVGWGLGGYCPGPGLVSATSGAGVLVFVGAMIVGGKLVPRA